MCPGQKGYNHEQARSLLSAAQNQVEETDVQVGPYRQCAVGVAILCGRTVQSLRGKGGLSAGRPGKICGRENA